MIRLLRHISGLFVAIVAIVSCERLYNHDDIIDKALDLNVAVSHITATSAQVKVTHSCSAESTWYGMLTEDLATPVTTLIDEQLNRGVSLDELHSGRQYTTTFDELKPQTEYRYIAIGLTAEGEKYGDVASKSFKTLSVSQQPVNGMVQNDAWRLKYCGAKRIDGTMYDHVVRLDSSDDYYYALTVVYAKQYDPEELYDFAEEMLDEMKEYLEDYNEASGTKHAFVDMLYRGTNEEHFDLSPGVYRALAIGYTSQGDVSGMYAVSQEFEVFEGEPSEAYSSWLGEWSVQGSNGVVTRVTIEQKVANNAFTLRGWEGFDELAIEVEYDDTEDVAYISSQCVAEEFSIGQEYGLVDIYLFAADAEGYYYDNSAGDYYIATVRRGMDGKPTVVSYGANTPGYPVFTQMFFMAEADDRYYALTAEEQIPTFGAMMQR